MMVSFAALSATLALALMLIRAVTRAARYWGASLSQAEICPNSSTTFGEAILLVAGAFSAEAFIAATCHAARRSVVLPACLAIVGYVVAACRLAATFLLPLALFPWWVLVASIVPLVQDARFASGTMASDTRKSTFPPVSQRTAARRSVKRWLRPPTLVSPSNIA
jgi:hypothetical protein